jgi:hypothetical protein
MCLPLSAHLSHTRGEGAVQKKGPLLTIAWKKHMRKLIFKQNNNHGNYFAEIILSALLLCLSTIDEYIE